MVVGSRSRWWRSILDSVLSTLFERVLPRAIGILEDPAAMLQTRTQRERPSVRNGIQRRAGFGSKLIARCQAEIVDQDKRRRLRVCVQVIELRPVRWTYKNQANRIAF